ncbi:hypothetical protein [Nocardioides sp. GY 10127]|uniref:hypothetical protein n=1 Tax=Nocardioides sp. GY 10127 TaxID=2569762 RepID=UPI0010A81144|nr:hypothetical protein [Nocardioides sp. GY 10127]TIC82661.1 hypothetical protein E8D37_08125 [Nocardioides sp. GY 10127]
MTSPVRVQPLDPVRDAALLDAALTAVSPGDPLAWMYLHWRRAEATGGLPCRWFVALDDDHDQAGTPVGLALAVCRPVAVAGFGSGLVSVTPSRRSEGVGTALRTVVEAAARGLVPGLVYEYREGEDDAEAARRAWGLAVSERHHESVLDLGPSTLERLAGVPVPDGVRLERIDDLDAVAADAWRGLHARFTALFADAPDVADGDANVPYEVFRGLLTQPWMLLLARDASSDALLGLTMVTERPGEAAAANTFFTGTTPAARGRGIATAVKAQQAVRMAAYGVRRLYTQNMVGNEPILAANRRLGFAHAVTTCDVPVPLDPA